MVLPWLPTTANKDIARARICSSFPLRLMYMLPFEMCGFKEYEHNTEK